MPEGEMGANVFSATTCSPSTTRGSPVALSTSSPRAVSSSRGMLAYKTSSTMTASPRDAMEWSPSALSSATVSILGSGTSSTVPRSMSIGVSVVSRFTLNVSDQRA